MAGGKQCFASLLVLAAIVASRCHLVTAEGSEDIDLGKLRVKELKKMLEERGVECEGCIEKDHILARVKETLELPVLSEEELAARKAEKEPKQQATPGAGGGMPGGNGGKGAGSWGSGGDYSKDMEMQELMKKMNMAGFGDKVKMFDSKEFMEYAESMKEGKDGYGSGEL